ncbi:MAG: PilZ domain-containing protein [Terriglobales bacterium]
MRSSNLPGNLRRSSRVPMTMPVTISSLDSAAQLYEVCETLVVSAHGCALRSPIKLDTGAVLQFRVNDGRQTTARVVDCQPLGNQPGWQVAAGLDLPGNFWGLPSCPDDWMRLTDMPSAGEPTAFPGNNGGAMPKMPMLRSLIAEMVEPLQAELADLQERLSLQRERNRFEVSLTHIPPEVEEKIWMRLREDLSAQSLRQTREHADKLLGAAQSAIELKITESQEEFRQWVREQLQTVGQQAQALSEQTANEMQQRLRGATEQFEQQASAAGGRLEQRGGEFLESLLQRLGEEREAHRRELEAVQAEAGVESSRLQEQLTELGRRMAELDETAHRLESGLSTRLMKMATETVSAARAQLQSAADSIFENLAARNAKDVGHQLEEATARLKSVQNEIEVSVSESVKSNVSKSLQSFEKTMDESAQRALSAVRSQLQNAAQSIFEDSVARNAKDVGHQLNEATARLKSIQNEIEVSVSESVKATVSKTLQSFEKTMDDSAQRSVGRWRGALAKDLNSVANILGEHFRSDGAADGSEKQ